MGWFVDAADSGGSFNDDPPFNSLPWGPNPINSGSYYWRALVNTHYDGRSSTWSPVATLTVRDEPALFEGWTLTAQRLAQRGRCKRLRVRSTIAFSDNEPGSPKASLTLVVRAGGKVKARIKWRDKYSGERLSSIACLANRKLTVTAYVRDSSGHLTMGPTRSLTVSSA